MPNFTRKLTDFLVGKENSANNKCTCGLVSIYFVREATKEDDANDRLPHLSRFAPTEGEII